MIVTNVTKKKRKARVIKGSYVDVESVNEERGEKYSSWIAIAKNQLKIRESKLLQIKVDTTNTIINGILSKYNFNQSFQVKDSIKSNTLETLYNTIDEWKGLQLSRIKTSFKIYRDYWNKSKKWFDQCKKKLLGDIYWYEIFIDIQQFTNNDKIIILLIMKSLFTGKVDYNNTRKLPLINSSTTIYSDKIQSYLQNLHETLKIDNWNINPFILMNNICAQLNQLTANIPVALDTSNNSNSNTHISSAANTSEMQSTSNNFNNQITSPMNTIYRNNQIIPSNNHTTTSINTHIHTNNINGMAYAPVHTRPHSVRAVRYMPYNSNNNYNINSHNGVNNAFNFDNNTNANYCNNTSSNNIIIIIT